MIEMTYEKCEEGILSWSCNVKTFGASATHNHTLALFTFCISPYLEVRITQNAHKISTKSQLGLSLGLIDNFHQSTYLLKCVTCQSMDLTFWF